MERADSRNPPLTVSETLEKIVDVIPRSALQAEDCPLLDLFGRVSAVDVVTRTDVPPFNRAAMDGYAIRSSDTDSTTPKSPLVSKVIGKIEAGNDPGALPVLGQKEAVQIFTGSPLPKSADAVVMHEECRRDGNRIYIGRDVAPFENVSRKGEDYRAGEKVLEKNTILKPWHVAALASLGRASMRVFIKPRVGILSTGSELVEPGEGIQPGKIYNSTKPMLISLATHSGFSPIDLGIVPDSTRLIKARLRKGLTVCDAVITTGGSSTSEKDLVPDVVSRFPHHQFVTRGIRIRPGGATSVAVVGRKPVFLLSGLPVAAFTAFEALVKPALYKLAGIEPETPATIKGKLVERISKREGIRTFVRVKAIKNGKSYLVRPLSSKGSGLISSLTGANGILVLKESTSHLSEGEDVEVQLLAST